MDKDLVHGMYRVGSLKTVARKSVKYKLDVVAVQEIRWVESGSQRAEDYTLYYGNENAKHRLGTGFFVYKVSYQ
jgi:exonuclease III